MKTCPNCKSEVDNNFDTCWNCMYNFDEKKVTEIKESIPGSRKIDCLRCQNPMHYSGNFRFHEGFLTGIFTNKETFDLYVCPKCGKVEFFMPQEEDQFKIF